jgi:hypothetical protein
MMMRATNSTNTYVMVQEKQETSVAIVLGCQSASGM